jgi:TRAP-type C4-dicarboxylate transport system substrate-binding protein
MTRAVADAVAFQRELHVEEEGESRRAIEQAGCDIYEPDAAEHQAFVSAVEPIYQEARAQYGDALIALARGGSPAL